MPSAEIEAMGAIEDSFVSLDDETRARVLAWAYAKYAAASELSMGRSPQKRHEESAAQTTVIVGELEATESEVRPADQFQHFGELFDHCDPSGPQERFLVAAYWLQVKVAKEAFGNAEVNKLLKDQGQEDSNLNKVVDRLRSKTPKFVNQLSGGASDKSRRVLKLTQPGLKFVEDMVQNGG